MRASLARALIAAAILTSAVLGGATEARAQSWPQGFSVTEENDAYDLYDDNTDRYYTQGLKVNVLGPDLSFGLLEAALLPLSGLDKPRVHHAVGLGQHIYTPEELLIPVPDPQDRPYAGWAYLSGAAFASDDDDLYSLEAQLGMVGPSAHAGEAQNGFHRLKDIAESLGWDHQLRDEFGANLYAEHRRVLWQADDDSVEIIGLRTLALGTVETSVGGGLIARVGYNLHQDFGPQRLRPGAAGTEFFHGSGDAFYFYAGLHVRGVAHDVFLDGNVFRESPSVRKKPIAPDLTLGVVWTSGELIGLPFTDRVLPPFRVGYAHVWQGEQFVGQNGPLEYGSLTFSLIFGGR